MGRNCGYLAVVSALVTGSDYVIIPEVPLPLNWREALGDTLAVLRKGKKHFLIIVAEGRPPTEWDFSLSLHLFFSLIYLFLSPTLRSLHLRRA